MSVQVTITHNPVCPDLSLIDTSAYGSDQNLYTYVKISVLDPSGNTTVFSSDIFQSEQLINPPKSFGSNQPVYQLDYLLSGSYIIKYISMMYLPGIVRAGKVFSIGENFEYQGVYYNVLTGFVNFADEDAADFISDSIGAGFLAIIDESSVNALYISTISFSSWCSLQSCYEAKLDRLNCLIVKQPTRTDLCDMKLYSEVMMLSWISYWVINILPTLDINEPVTIDTINKHANYVNSICSCDDCCKSCK